MANRTLILAVVAFLLASLPACKSVGGGGTTGSAGAASSRMAGAGGGEFRLDESGRWLPVDGAGEDAAGGGAIARARALLALDRPLEAWSVLDGWLEEHEQSDSPLLAQAFLLRGDAVLASGNEYKALYDYERVIIDFPGSPEYARAVERELEIGIRYLHGLRRKLWGIRFAGAIDVGEELLVRVQERMPGSALAERAGIELADFYYRTRDMAAASEAYEVFVVNHPRSEHAGKARQMRIFANIARFKGPDYDASGLTEARVLIEEYAAIDPVGAQRAGLSDALTARLEESAAAQQLRKARWYLTRGDAVSARFMLRRVVRDHPRTVSADVALELLAERGWGAE